MYRKNTMIIKVKKASQSKLKLTNSRRHNCEGNCGKAESKCHKNQSELWGELFHFHQDNAPAHTKISVVRFGRQT